MFELYRSPTAPSTPPCSGLVSSTTGDHAWDILAITPAQPTKKLRCWHKPPAQTLKNLPHLPIELPHPLHIQRCEYTAYIHMYNIYIYVHMYFFVYIYMYDLMPSAEEHLQVSLTEPGVPQGLQPELRAPQLLALRRCASDWLTRNWDGLQQLPVVSDAQSSEP